ncbi:MAG TPA: RNA polymerase sigma-54 factor [Syntrophomonas sp.]|jgi:RNA polymerase sigma-54 factor|nr:RNA polymerase sigma-54 factor [Syntrophomonas sp.]
MRLTHDVILAQQQKLLMTPELRQAIAILQMSSLELSEYIRNELAENPLLEEKPDVEEPADAQDESEPETNDDISEWLDVFGDSDRDTYDAGVNYQGEEKSLENYLAQKPSLYEHLEFQLHLFSTTPEEQEIGQYLIGSIDQNGYLTAKLDDVARQLNVDLEEVEKALELIQSFNPPGLGARDLPECLILQLRQYDKDSEIARNIINNHLTDLARGRLNHIAQKVGAPVRKVQEICDLIRTLDPKPGLQFSGDEIKYVTPDVIVEKIEGEYVVIINDFNFPRLIVNNMYESMLKQADAQSQEARKYLEEKIGSAIWLIRSIEQRRMTLYRVSRCIVDLQTEFLDKGVKYLKPMTLRQVAEMINVHESTVSRATTNKYMQTPQGLFELKYFFSTGVECSGEDKVSSKSIKHMLQDIVAREDPQHPISDEAISQQLQEKGIRISRRTVAKYRQELNIPSTSARRRY